MTTANARSTALLDRPGPIDLGVLTPSVTGAFLTFALGFLSFMPYPAIPVGRSSAIQAGNILTLLMVLPCLALPWRRRPFLFFPLLVAPLALASLKVAVTGNGSLELCLKALPLWTLSLLTMVATQLFAPRYALHLMTGIALATLIHVGVGMWQLHEFGTGQLPLVQAYINPSFLTVQDRERIISLYIQRPFGLFPEPSAMSSCLAPWILLWLADLFGLLRFRQEPRTWQKVLFACAALGGLVLIVLSRSGHTLAVMAGGLLLFLAWLKNSSASARTYAVLLLVAGVALPVLGWLTFNAMQDRVADNAMGNDSWDDRATSMLLGFRLLVGDGGVSLLVGLGAGQTADLLWNMTGLDAVWSVLLTYIYETGFVGAMVVSWIGWHLFAIWREGRTRFVFALVVGVWLVGITITTSYQQLLPLWVTLGWLTIWPEVCEAPGARPSREPRKRGGRFIPVRLLTHRQPLPIARPVAPESTGIGASV